MSKPWSSKCDKNRSLLYDSAKLNDGKGVDVGVDDHANDCFDGCVDGCVDDSVDVSVEDGADDDVDGGIIYLTHFTQKVDCCLMGIKEHNVCGECQDHGVPNVTKSRNWLSDSAKLNDGKEVD
eukprot:15329223-Ditylum_brightwellii.AAC.1